MTQREAEMWAAGFFEGEGSISLYGPVGRLTRNLKLTSTDFDSLDRFHQVVGKGSISDAGARGRHGYRCGPQCTGNHKPQRYWYLTDMRGIKEVLLALWDGLGERRQEDAARLLVHIEEYLMPCVNCGKQFSTPAGQSRHRRYCDKRGGVER